MSVSAHIAAQRTGHAVPHAVSCRALGVAPSTFYKWRDRPPTPARRRRAELDVDARACFDASDGTYGSPRVRAELRRSGREVSERFARPSLQQGDLDRHLLERLAQAGRLVSGHHQLRIDAARARPGPRRRQRVQSAASWRPRGPA